MEDSIKLSVGVFGKQDGRHPRNEEPDQDDDEEGGDSKHDKTDLHLVDVVGDRVPKVEDDLLGDFKDDGRVVVVVGLVVVAVGVVVVVVLGDEDPFVFREGVIVVTDGGTSTTEIDLSQHDECRC